MVGFAKNQFTRIKNPHTRRQTRDFEFGIYSFIFMLIIGGVFSAAYILLAGQALQQGAIARTMLGLVLSALVYLVLPRWSAIIPAMLLAQFALFFPVNETWGEAGAALAFEIGALELIPVAGALMAVIFGPSLQVVLQWDKVVVLRLGRFQQVHNPGPFFLLPLLDRCAAFVDTRIRVTDFSAEKILTRDTVPVHVDALAFWMIWDARKAILEVEDFLEAVTLSAQTALRDSIGKYSLTTLLSERETLYQEIQTILDAKTNPWGITILSVEFTDIVLPPELEDVMSKQAQAEREKEARLFLAKAEREVAKEFSDAAEVYRGNPEALNLRAMNMVYDGIKNNGSLVLLPSGALENMNLGSVMGVSSLAEAHAKNRRAAAGFSGTDDRDPASTDGADPPPAAAPKADETK
jgi:regulator of protease activity HflC (stomatin/prohibitin superfamily)